MSQKKVQRSDPAWKYGKELVNRPTLQDKKYKYIECNFCKRVVTGGVLRMKHHLAKTHKNIAPCTAVPEAVQKEMDEYLKIGEKTKSYLQRNREELIDSGSYYVNENPCYGGSSGGSVSQRGVRGPMDKYVVDIDVDDDSPRPNPVGEKEARKNCCLDIGRFFFENGIAFNVANSPSFVNMCRSIGNYGRGLKPPTSHELSTWVLNEEEKTTQAIVDDIKKIWPLTGVSIVSDGWKDMRGRQLINFLVNNPHGTVFLRSVDASDAVKTARMLCKLFESVIEEVGEELVIQIVTDNAANYKAAGKLLMERKPHIWWTPCAAHCIDLILEKIGDLSQHKNALMKSKKMSNYIYNHGWVLALMRKFTNRKLIRLAATRFATAYLTLESMERLRDPLDQMFTSFDWKNSTYAKDKEGKKVMQIVVRDNNFWVGVDYALKSTKPLVGVLRMADSEKMPGMGFVYGCMDKAKAEIAKNLGGGVGSYNEIWKIIDAKWEFQMHRDLHIAAYSLNPHFQYDNDMGNSNEATNARIACLGKIYPNEKDQEKVELQMDKFMNKLGLFGYTAAKSTSKKRSPVDWWLQYGQDTPELMNFAVKILSLTCSSSACERNWSTFNQVHTKTRNRLATTKLNKLVFIMYNKRLKNKWLKKKSLKEDEDPLVVDEIPSDDEWVVDPNENSFTLPLDLSDSDGEDEDDVDVEDVVGGDSVDVVYQRRGRGRGNTRGRGRGGGKRKRDTLEESD